MQEPSPANLDDLVAALDRALAEDRAQGRRRNIGEQLGRLPGLAGLPLALVLDHVFGVQRPGPGFGPYRLLGEIGRDEASLRQHAIAPDGRPVVLRVFNRRPEFDDHDLAELRAELVLARSLDLPALVDLRDAGLAEGLLYLVEEPAAGPTLSTALQRLEAAPGPGVATRTALLRQIGAAARLLDRAHQIGIVHGRLGPASIVLGPRGPAIKGLGVAALEGRRPLRASLTELAYRAPEQLGEAALRTDRRADVWAFGALVHRIVTGELPIPAPTEAELRRESARFVPRSAKAAERGLPAELDAVIAAALAPERARRYGSAGLFADDLDRALAGRPPLARRPALGNRFLRWMRREPGIATAGFVLFAVLGTIGVVTGWFVGVGDRDRAILPLEARIAAEEGRRREEANAARESTRDLRLAEVIEEQGLLLDVVHSGQFRIDADRRIFEAQIAAWGQRGIELDQRLELGQAAGILDAAFGRSPTAARKILGGLYRLVGQIDTLRSGAGDAAEVARLERIERNLIILVERCEKDPALRHLWRSARNDASRFDRLDAFLEPGSWRQQGEDYLRFLAERLLRHPERAEAGRQLIAEAVDLHPDAVGLQVFQASLLLASRPAVGGPDPEVGARARRHLEVAVALRPRSPAIRVLLALVQAGATDYRSALVNVEEAGRLAPDSALIAYLRARFYRGSPMTERARDAAEHALACDPSLDEARDLLIDLDSER
ncbi:MAG: hypothetical protein H6807_01525 [Planctomycetes bacterium]|nr:hypothetical protein [Planctomycetota bacterium]